MRLLQASLPSPPLPPPLRQVVSSAENLGEVLRGDRIENSLYDVSGQA